MRILVVEDTPEPRELMSWLLQAFGYEVIEARDGEEALRLIELERPDLVLCDIQMPKLDGYEVARRLRALPQTADLPLVAITAFAMRGDEAKALAAGFTGYISKPIAPERFVGQVESFLTMVSPA